METTITLDRAPTTDAEYETEIDRMMSEMEQMQVTIAEKQRRTEKLQAQTREKLVHFQKILARIEAS